MTAIGERVRMTSLPLESAQAAPGLMARLVFRRLDAVVAESEELTIDDQSRLILFSDCHRGDRGISDAFAGNEPLFFHTLRHYYQQGFSYVEVGDGDELWQNRRFEVIHRAYRRVFELLHDFDGLRRLYLIIGNHELQQGYRDMADKDGMITREGLVLRYNRTGQRIFVTHGHQADILSDRMIRLSRPAVRVLWRGLRSLGIRRISLPQGLSGQHRIESGLLRWLEFSRLPLICGHTHRATFPAVDDSPYFNTGSCSFPGFITGIEIQNGEMSLVKWTATESRSGNEERILLRRELMATPRKLSTLLYR